ncbi:MAG: nucleotidyltransferase family protein [Elusimicrobia bacterium]|nr:nucleotidyltransferase family protein [Elusimicrobiota bacterium]
MNSSLVYLLAAGHGRRAGGPKAWLESEGRPLLARQLEFLLRRFPPASVAVSVQEAWLERCRALQPAVRWVSVDPEASPLASLQALMRALPLTSWAFLYHVDMPVWNDELFTLLGTFPPKDRDRPYEAVVPTHGGGGGHPVLLSPFLREPLAVLPPESGRLDHFLRGRRTFRVEVPYPCVVENWNSGPAS